MRSVDGHALPIDELKGTKPVESIDLSGKGLGAASGFIIGACIKENAVLKELNLNGNNLTNYGEDMSGILKLAEALPHSQLTSLRWLTSRLNFAWTFVPLLAFASAARNAHYASLLPTASPTTRFAASMSMDTGSMMLRA